MTDRDHQQDLDPRRDPGGAQRAHPADRAQGGGTHATGGPPDFERTAYGRPETGVGDRVEGFGTGSGGYGDQGGYGSQHGQGGYASPAQGSRYGQTGSEWGRNGYGEEGGRDSRGRDGRERGGEGGGYGFRGQGGGGAQWAGAGGYGEGGYGGAGGTYGQRDTGPGAQRSQARRDDATDAQAFGRDGRHEDHDHDPHYRRWRDEQLSGHDRDYDRWRTAQAQRYDEDYRKYRDERHSQFSSTFNDWRTQRSQPQTSAATGAGTSHPPAPSGSSSQAEAGAPASGGDPHLQSVTDGGDGRVDQGHEDKSHDDTTST